MTKDEFIVTLSSKAQSIVEEHLKLFHSKSFQVFYSDVSKVVIKDNSDYFIYVKNDKPEDIEYRFLHEFFHCVQYETGFPQLTNIDSEYEVISTSISSLILDLDIRERLENNGYYQDLKYIKESVKMQTRLLKMIKQIKDKEEMTSLDDIIGMAGIMLTSDIANVKNNELYSYIKITRPNAIKYYKILKDSVKLYSYNTALGVNDIFTYLLEKLELTAFMKIEFISPICSTET